MTQNPSDPLASDQLQRALTATGVLLLVVAAVITLPLGSMVASLDERDDDADADPASVSLPTDETTPTTSPTDETTPTTSPTDDGDGDDGGGEPVIERFVLTDRSNPQWARVEVEWAITHDGGNLESVRTELDGGVDSEADSIDGSIAIGSHELRERGGHGEVEVTLTVTDGDGNSVSETRTIRLG